MEQSLADAPPASGRSYSAFSSADGRGASPTASEGVCSHASSCATRHRKYSNCVLENGISVRKLRPVTLEGLGSKAQGQSCAKQPGQGCACPWLPLHSRVARGELAPFSALPGCELGHPLLSPAF